MSQELARLMHKGDLLKVLSIGLGLLQAIDPNPDYARMKQYIERDLRESDSNFHRQAQQALRETGYLSDED
jgi:hypothetical protein